MAPISGSSFHADICSAISRVIVDDMGLSFWGWFIVMIPTLSLTSVSICS